MTTKEKRLIGVVTAIILFIGLAIELFTYVQNIQSGEGDVTITVNDGEQDIIIGEYHFEEDETLLDLMERELDAEHVDTFIHTITGIEQDADNNEFWVFEVNDEMINVGAAEYMLQDEDDIVWELMQF